MKCSNDNDIEDESGIERSIKRLDRKKRDIEPTEGVTKPTNVEEEIEGDAVRKTRDLEESASEDLQRSARQLRPPPIQRSPWQYSNEERFAPSSNGQSKSKSFHASIPHTRSNYHQYLTPPGLGQNYFYNNDESYEHQSETNHNYKVKANNLKRLPDGEHSFSSHYKGSQKSPQFLPFDFNAFGKPINTHDNLNDKYPDNFSYFHLHKPADEENDYQLFPKSNKNNENHQSQKITVIPNATPKHNYISISTVGGFYNNHPTKVPKKEEFRPSPQFELRPAHQTDSNPSLKFMKPTKHPFVYITTAPVYENTEEGYSGQEKYYSTTPKAPTIRPQVQSTTLRIAPDIGSDDYYSGNIYLQQAGINGKRIPQTSQYRKPERTKLEPTTKSPSDYYFTQEPTREQLDKRPSFDSYAKATTTTKRPDLSGPFVGLNFDFDKFVANIRETHLSQMDSKLVRPSQSKFNSEVTTRKPINEQDTKTIIKVNPSWNEQTFLSNTSIRPFPQFASSTPKQSPRPTTSRPEDYYYYDDINSENESKFKKQRPVTKAPPRGYDNLLNSIPNSVKNNYESTNTANEADEEEEYYYDDDYDYQLPANKSQFMPLSETMAPRLKETSTPSIINLTALFHGNKNMYNNHHYVRPEEPTTEIPAIIKFPADIFHDIRPIESFVIETNTTTVRPFTIRPHIQRPTTTTQQPTTTTSVPSTRLKTTTAATSKTTTRKVYTIRPTRNRGNNRWKPTQTTKRPANIVQSDLDERLPNR